MKQLFLTSEVSRVAEDIAKRMETKGKRLEHAYVDDQVPLIALTNSQYVHVRDDWMQVVDVK